MSKSGLSVSVHSEMIRVLDEQSRIQAMALQKIHSIRNSLIPVAFLPPEILINVFELLMLREEVPFSYFSVGCHRTNKWLVVTWVCQRWRKIALECPTLWSNHITFSLRDQVEGFLERSSRSSLTVHHHPGFIFRQYPTYMPLVLEHMDRVYEITINGDTMDRERWQPVMKHIISRPAPRLRRLSLSEQRNCTSYPSLFGGEWPTLKWLSLHRIHLPWNAPLFHGLTKLSLWDIVPRFTMAEWLHILQNCPELEVLALRNCGVDGSKSCDIEPISLPRLRSIDLRNNSADAIGKIIRSVVFPPTVCWIIECSNAPMIHRPDLVIPHEYTFSAKSLCINLQPVSKQLIIEASSELDAGDAENRCTRKYELSYNDSAEKPDGFTVLNSILVRSHWRDATRLDFKGNIYSDAMPGDAWNKLFSALPLLQELIVDFNDGYRRSIAEEGLAEALIIPNNSDGSYSCPRLSLLTIKYANFTANRTQFPQRLAECLEKRSERGLRLKSLEILKAIGIEQGQINAFKGWVVDFHWDEVAWVDDAYDSPWEQDNDDEEPDDPNADLN